MKFRGDIEGLRALAVLPVVLFHAFPQLIPGGYVGVDVFFVISGYLITGLLVDRLATNTYSLKSFYAARVRRIFPALFVMLGVTTVLVPLCLPVSEWKSYASTLASTATFISNHVFYGSSGYFEGASELKPLLHTWSLAVEEQYYIVFPPLLACLWRFWRRMVLPVVLILASVSLAFCWYWTRYDASWAFYMAPLRAYELLFGAALALAGADGWLQKLGPRTRQGLSWLGLAMVLLPCLAYGPYTPFPGVAALVPSLGAACLIAAGTPDRGTALAPFITRWLHGSFLRSIGAMSFSLYLWHWPVLVIARHLTMAPLGLVGGVLAVLLAMALAWMSWRWIETPARTAKLSEPRLLGWGLVAIVLTLLVAWWMHNLAVQRLAAPTAADRWLREAEAVSPLRRDCHANTGHAAAYAQRCRIDVDGRVSLATGANTVAVWADSHGVELALALAQAPGLGRRPVLQITGSSCPPAVGLDIPGVPACRRYNDDVLAQLLADRSVNTVVFAARHARYYQDQGLGDAYVAALGRTIQAVRAAGKQVLLVGPVPTYHYPVPAALANLGNRGELAGPWVHTLEAHERAQAPTLAALRALSASTNLPWFDVAAVLCPQGSCTVQQGGRAWYFDDNHLSPAGAGVVAQALASRLPPAGPMPP